MSHSLDLIQALAPGYHLCCLYSTEDEHRAQIVPFLRAGFTRHEKVLYIADEHSVATMLAYLRDDGLDPAPYLASGQLRLMTVADTYLRGGVFDPDRMIDLLRQEANEALAAGYTALRVTGEMDWAWRGMPGAERLIEYESKLDTFLPNSGCLALCQYDRRVFDPSLLRQVLEIHPLVLMGSVVYDNFYYVPPDELLHQDRDAALLARWLDTLAARQWAEKSVQLLQEVAVAANAARSLEDVLPLALARVCAFAGWPVGHAYLLDENSGELAPSNIWSLQKPDAFPRFRDVTRTSRFRRGEGLPGRVYASGRPAWISDVREDRNFLRAAIADVEVRAAFAFPVMAGTDVVAVLEFYAAEPGEPDARLLETMGHIGTQLGRVVERARAERSLRASEAKFRTVTQSAPDAIVLIDEDGRVVFWNQAAETMFGYTAAEVVNGTLDLIMPARHRAGHRAGMERLRQGGAPRLFGRTLEVEGLRRDGSEFPLELSLAVWQDVGRTYYSGILRDITERKEGERQLAVERNLLRTLIDTLPDYIYVKDRQSRFLLNNSAHLKQLGASAQSEVLGKADADVFPPDLAARYWADEQGVMERQRQLINREELTVDAAGRQQWVLSTKVPLVDDEGDVIGLVGVTRDVTDRKLVQDALEQSEARFRAIFAHAAVGMAIVDLEGHVLLANPALAAMLGYDMQSLPGMDLVDFTHPEDRAATLTMARQLLAGEIDHYRMEKRYIHRQGHIVWGRVTCSVVANQEGEHQFLQVMIEDVTERRLMEVNLRELRRHLAQSREAERSHLARELHDVPIQELYVAQFALQALIERSAESSELAALDEIKERLLSVNALLRGICNELRPPALENFGLDAALRAHIEEFQAAHPHLSVDLALEDVGDKVPVETAMVLFRICQQALNNVVKHAGARQVTVQMRCTQNEVILSIQDDGNGFTVPPSWLDLARQGHYGVAGMVERAETVGGALTIHSQPGQGTRIRVAVPLPAPIWA